MADCRAHRQSGGTTTRGVWRQYSRRLMAFWDQLKAKAQEMNGQLKTKTSQFQNKEFKNASMAMCALIAAADGSIDPSERQKTAALIMSNESLRSEEHTSEIQSLMRISYAVFCLKKKNNNKTH